MSTDEFDLHDITYNVHDSRKFHLPETKGKHRTLHCTRFAVSKNYNYSHFLQLLGTRGIKFQSLSHIFRVFDAHRDQRNKPEAHHREAEKTEQKETEGDGGRDIVNWIGDFSRGRHSRSERPDPFV